MTGKKKFIRILFVSVAVVILIMAFSLFVGEKFSFPSGQIFSLRFLRILTAALCGASLAAAGCGFQMVFSNPLADPYLLGSSASAALGVVLVRISGIFPWWADSVVAGIFSLLAVLFVLKISGRFSSRNVILTGVVLNFLLSAVVVLLVSLKRKEAYSVFYFLMGDLQQTNENLLLASGFVAFVAAFFLYRKSREINAVSFGAEVASHLGVDFEKSCREILIVSSFLVGASVSVAGTVGFVGLMAPHIARMLGFCDARFLIPASAASGAVILLVSDIFARRIIYPSEIPVGVITSVFGAALFLWLFLKRGRT